MLHPLIVLSSFCFFAAGLSIGIFSKDNARKNRRDDPKTKTQGDVDRKDNLSIGANTNRETRANNLDIKTNANAEADNLNIVENNSGIAADNPDTKANNLGTIINNPGIAADNSITGANNSRIVTDNLGIRADNPGTKMDIDTGANNLSIAVSNKARIASLFTLCHAFFFLISSSELVTASLPSFLQFLFSTTLRSKLILLYLVTLVKRGFLFSRYSVNKMWIPSLNKVLSRISTVVK